MLGQERRSGHVIAFHGGKPGEGKSLLAQCVSTALAQDHARSVLLFDADPQGRLEHWLRAGIDDGPTIAEVIGRIQRFDEAILRGYFPKTVAGVEIACLARSAQQALELTTHQVLQVLDLFRRAHDILVLDGLSGWDPLTLALLDQADRVLMLCPPDLVGLRHARLDSRQYQELKFPAAKIALVLNRADAGHALQPEDVRRAIPEHPLIAAIPWAPQAVEAVNRNLDLMTLLPQSPMAKACRALARAALEPIGSVLTEGPALAVEKAGTAQPAPAGIDPVRIKERIHQALLENPELKGLAAESRQESGRARLREKVESVVTSLMALEAPEVTAREARERLVQEVVDEALGLGPLEDLMRDAEVTEIMVNARDRIYVERRGKLAPVDKHFVSDKQLMTVIERIVAPLGRRLDESQPYVDARLPDGSRVNAIIPPLALRGPTLTIRKFAKHRLGMADLVRFGSLTAEMGEWIGACVLGRKNIVISGGTGSGKTTLLNIIASYIPAEERIVTVEDAAELNLPQPHVVTLETRPPNLEGRGAVTIRELVKNSLRMRPDRIVVGECRAGEALDMLQAMNTGHDGSLTTAHANSPKDVISRLETMVLMSGMDLPVRAIREQIAGAVHLVVQQSRLQDGSRKVTQIAEVTGLEDGVIQLKDIFVFRQTGLDKQGRVQGEFKATGHVPGFVKDLSARGIQVSEKLFRKS